MDVDDPVRESGDEQEDQDEPEEEEEDGESTSRTEDRQDKNGSSREANNSNSADESRQDNSRPGLNTRSRHSQSRNVPRRGSSKASTHTPSQQPPSQKKQSWRSANAFVNFMQDYRKDNASGTSSKNVFRLCGERWKSMTDEQKQPYIEAAKMVRQRKQHQKASEPGEQAQLQPQQQRKPPSARIAKRKAESKRKQIGQKKTKASTAGNSLFLQVTSDSDTDTATMMSDADSF